MRWPTESTRVGRKRVRRPFAWLPVRIGKEWVWLERYEVDETFEERVDSWGQTIYRWVVQETRTKGPSDDDLINAQLDEIEAERKP